MCIKDDDGIFEAISHYGDVDGADRQMRELSQGRRNHDFSCSPISHIIVYNIIQQLHNNVNIIHAIMILWF